MTSGRGKKHFNPLAIFRIKHEERWMAVAALLYVVLWNALVVCKYADKFFPLSKNYRSLFVKHFHISGFDPVSDVVISQWNTDYNIYRHPLLAFFMYLPNQLNQGLMMLTGENWATVIMALILVFCAFYSFILLYRIFREVAGLRQTDSWLLCWLTFSFGYTMVTISVPDHFCLSMFMLILTLYVAGRKMKAHHPFTKWQTILFFIVTAGISLNNGIKIFLSNWSVNGRKFFRPANLLIVVVMPSLVIWGGARLEWKHFERPNFEKRQMAKAKKDSTLRAQIYTQIEDTISVKDPSAINKVFNQEVRKRAQAKYRRHHKKTGIPIDNSEFGQWTDISTPRWPSLVENFFGEPIQMHQDYLMGDIFNKRPVIVEYRYAINYVVEGIVVLLFIVGIICGTIPKFGMPRRFLLLALSFMAFDFLINFVLGFGINEAYIMSSQWLFIMTIAMAFLIRRVNGTRWLLPLRMVLLALTVYLMAWNGVLYAGYLL